MALLTGWPTDGAEGSVSSEARWRAMAKLWAPSGVVDDFGGELAPTLGAGVINVAAGAAFVDGHYCELTSPASRANSTNGLLVVRFTPADNEFELVYRDAVSTPTQSDATWELPIAKMTAGALTDLRRLVGGDKSQPSARWTRPTDMAIVNLTETTLQGTAGADLARDHQDDLGLWTQAAGVVTVNRAGVYDITAGMQWQANATGYRTVTILKNAVVAAVGFSAASGVNISLNVATGPVAFAAADTFRAQVFQNSGGSLNLIIAGFRPFLSVAKVG